MKIYLTKALVIILFSLSIPFSLRSQITLEKDFNNQRLDVVSLEHSGVKYYQYDYSAHVATLFNLDYSIFKTINFPHIPSITYNAGHFSESLFDIDSTTIEYVLSFTDSANSGFKIFSVDSILLFEADSGAIVYANEYGSYNSLPYAPIFNTDSGTKMIVAYTLPFSSVYHTSVYSLPGKLSGPCCKNGLIDGIISLNNKHKRIRAYPNPFFESTVFEYTLPFSEKKAELIITDLEGKIVCRYNLESTQNKIEKVGWELPSGVYNFSVITSSGEVLSEKMIKVE